MEPKHLKIDTANVFLLDHGDGKGEIVISDSENGTFTYFWGSMGSSLPDFLKGISTDYFVNKLCLNTSQFCAQKSVSNIRKYIRENLKSELPWYKYQSGQKELREELRKLSQCRTSDEFVDMCLNLPYNKLSLIDLDRYDDEEFREILASFLRCEPWHFIDTVPTREAKYLAKFHVKLKQALAATAPETAPEPVK